MGAVDLVIQVESPRSVARGMQRIGRAGHQVGAPSRGRVFPKYRGDLLECAAVVARMRERRDRGDPRAPAAAGRAGPAARGHRAPAAPGRWTSWSAVVRGAYPFAELSREQLEGVLDMLAGPLPVRRVRRAAAAGGVGPHAPARCAAATAPARWRSRTPGTIPDRGLYAVVLPDGARVGELDEEMVYEARTGQTFMLGASTWRIEEITRDRVVVTPAPGRARGGSVLEGRGRGAARTSWARPSGGWRASWSRPVPERAAARLRDESAFDRARRDATWSPTSRTRPRATGTVPSDRAIVVERFRDEIGDWRLCVLTPFGARVHAPWALALGARHPRGDRPGGARHLGRRRHRPAPARRRRGAPVRPRPDRPRRARGAGAGRARRHGAVRRPLPRERGPRPPHPPPPPRAAHPALAAAAEGVLAAPGGAPVRQLPGDPRDLPRVPRRLVRPARPARRAGPGAVARAGRGGGRDRDGVALRRLAAVRVRRVLHVRGRHARRPSGAPRRCPSTATCCASCSARRSCAT